MHVFVTITDSTIATDGGITAPPGSHLLTWCSTLDSRHQMKTTVLDTELWITGCFCSQIALLTFSVTVFGASLYLRRPRSGRHHASMHRAPRAPPSHVKARLTSRIQAGRRFQVAGPAVRNAPTPSCGSSCSYEPTSFRFRVVIFTTSNRLHIAASIKNIIRTLFISNEYSLLSISRMSFIRAYSSCCTRRIAKHSSRNSVVCRRTYRPSPVCVLLLTFERSILIRLDENRFDCSGRKVSRRAEVAQRIC